MAQTLGAAIRARRIELGWTQEELAERIGGGVRQADVSRLERDRITLPRRERLEAMANALGVTAGELLARSGWAGADEILPTRAPVPAAASPSEHLISVTPSPGVPRFGRDIARLRAAIERSHKVREESASIVAEIASRQAAWYDPPQREPVIDPAPAPTVPATEGAAAQPRHV